METNPESAAVEAVAWRDDLVSVLESANEASAVPLIWLANTDFTPEQTKAWMCEAVDNTVADGAFSGELHSIAEEESGHVVAFTGCGPKSAANAKFLIWCAHFVLKHGDSLLDHASALDALRGEVVSTNARRIELGERIARLADLRANDAAYIKKLDGIIEETGVRPVSCINPYEDLKAVVLALKKRAAEADAAERRAADLTSLLSDTAGNLRRMANDEFADCDQVRLEHVVNRIDATLRQEKPE